MFSLSLNVSVFELKFICHWMSASTVEWLKMYSLPLYCPILAGVDATSRSSLIQKILILLCYRNQRTIGITKDITAGGPSFLLRAPSAGIEWQKFYSLYLTLINNNINHNDNKFSNFLTNAKIVLSIIVLTRRG